MKPHHWKQEGGHDVGQFTLVKCIVVGGFQVDIHLQLLQYRQQITPQMGSHPAILLLHTPEPVALLRKLLRKWVTNTWGSLCSCFAL